MKQRPCHRCRRTMGATVRRPPQRPVRRPVCRRRSACLSRNGRRHSRRPLRSRSAVGSGPSVRSNVPPNGCRNERRSGALNAPSSARPNVPLSVLLNEPSNSVRRSVRSCGCRRRHSARRQPVRRNRARARRATASATTVRRGVPRNAELAAAQSSGLSAGQTLSSISGWARASGWMRSGWNQASASGRSATPASRKGTSAVFSWRASSP